jgi:hypothetical protein
MISSIMLGADMVVWRRRCGWNERPRHRGDGHARGVLLADREVGVYAMLTIVIIGSVGSSGSTSPQSGGNTTV